MARKAKWLRRSIIAVLALLVLAGVAASMRPEPVDVEVASVERGDLTVTIGGEGRARLPDRQTLSAPVAGELRRIALRPGDALEAKAVVAEILPSASPPLDERTRDEALARQRVARAALSEARKNVERADIAAEVASREAARMRALAASGSVTARSMELAEAEQRAREAEASLARLAVERARREVEAIAAMLAEPGSGRDAKPLEVMAPSAGRVLEVHAQSAGPVQPGTPLLDVGGAGGVELVVELPTRAAMRVAPGAAVRVEGAGGRGNLAGVVRLVEPAAFTKITALGVEEQRVNVIVDPTGDIAGWSTLGDGFAADAHIAVHEATDVLKVPVGAVFREAGGFAVFAIVEGRAALVRVEVGERSADEVEIRAGLVEGDVVVVHPSDKLAAGSRVAVER